MNPKQKGGTSHSNMKKDLTFITRHGFQTTMPLAHGLDSLVRVSRRVEQELKVKVSDISNAYNTKKDCIFWIFSTHPKRGFPPLSNRKKEPKRNEFLKHFKRYVKPRSWAQWLVKKNFIHKNEEHLKQDEPISTSLFLVFFPARAHQPRIDADALVIQFVRWHPELIVLSWKSKQSIEWFYLLQDKRQPRFKKRIKGFQILFASPSTTSSSLNSLFKVLCNFPSRYLFAIDLSSEYLALDGVYHPCWGCILKQPDSGRLWRQHRFHLISRPMKVSQLQNKFYFLAKVKDHLTGFSPSLMPFSKGLLVFLGWGVGCALQRLQLKKNWFIIFLVFIEIIKQQEKKKIFNFLIALVCFSISKNKK